MTLLERLEASLGAAHLELLEHQHHGTEDTLAGHLTDARLAWRQLKLDVARAWQRGTAR